MTIRPPLRCYGEFRPADFVAQPIWICAYGVDQDEPWCDELDEITYRPWRNHPPFGTPQFSATHLLARAVFIFSDGTRAEGFATPRLRGPRESDARELGFTQPSLFLPNGVLVSFWTAPAVIPSSKATLYSAFRREAGQVFPIQYTFECELPVTVAPSVIPGFATLTEDGDSVLVDR